MNDRQTASALVITTFLIIASFSTLAAVSRTAVATAIPDGVVYVDNNGFTVRSHAMTNDEMLQMKAIVGVKEQGKNYNVIVDGHGTGLAPPTEDEWGQMVGQYDIVDSVAPSGVLLAALDLSANPTFPKVGNQGGQGSCAAWAATYYSYGYLEAVDNGWTGAKSGTTSNLMSAAWTYNKVNSGYDGGSWMSTNMGVIRDWGGATLATMPYSDRDPYSWGSMEAFREAPLHRGGMVHGIAYMGPSTVDSVKALLSAGTPITFAFDAGEYTPAFADGNYVMSSKEYDSFGLNHAQTIVGYDDSIQDDGERGAFRVVNSWSAGWGDAGFYWLTYDAFMELGQIGVLNLTYMEDLANYVPSLLAVWHFNSAPTRSTDPKVGIGPYLAPVEWRIPYFEHENLNKFPTFMALDMTEFKDTYDSGKRDFFLSHGSASTNGVVSDFKVELYEGGYIPGRPTQVTYQSPDVPKMTPGIVTNRLEYYGQLPLDIAVDMTGLVFTSSSSVRWTSVDHTSYRDGSSIQSGDVGDSKTTETQITVNGPVDFWFHWKISSETGADFLSFSVDGFKLAAISGDLDWRPMHYSLSAGAHALKWEYSKNAANSERSDCGWVDNMMIDSAPPVTSHSISGSLGSDGWYVSSAMVYLTASDENGSGVDRTSYRVDGGLWLTYNTPIPVSGEGTHYVDYYSVDIVGNTEVAKRAELKIDNSGPQTTVNLIGTTGTGGWYITPVTLDFLASDTQSGVDWTRYSIDGGSWQYGNLIYFDVDGVYTVEFESKDMAGNIGPMDSVDVNVDQQLPATTMSVTGTIGSNDWYTSDVGISLSSSDETSGIAWTGYRVDSGAWLLYNGFFMILDDGVHIVEFYSQDNSGNREATLNSTVKIDHLAPVLQINQADGIVFTTTSTTISWFASDAISGLERSETSLDGAPFQAKTPAEFSLSISGLSQGSHTIAIKVVDAAGLVTEKQIDFVVDSLPPASSESLAGMAGQNGWFVSPVIITLSASDATTGVKTTRYRIDGGAWQVYSAGFSISTEKTHKVEYYSTDNAGNVEPTRELFVRIDTVGPASTATFEATSGLNNWYVTSALFTITASDATSGVSLVKYRIDSGAWITYSAPFTIATDGAHTVEYYSQDVAGHAETVASESLKMDCTPPLISILSPLGDVGADSVNISWSGRDYASGLERFEIDVDGAGFEDLGSATYTVRTLGNGNHTVVIRDYDNAGNYAEKRLDFAVHGVFGGNGQSGLFADEMIWIIYALIGGLAASLFLLVFAAAKRRRPEKTSSGERTRLPPPPPPSRVDLNPPPPPPGWH